ncbi:MAG: hypothetical protein RIT45_3911 [Pseudomonadota bacterium]
MTRTRTRTATQTRVTTERSLQQLGLTDVEEKVVRMRHGLALAPDAELEFRGQEIAETRAALAAIEARALGALSVSDEARIKAEIIDELRKI